MKEKSTPSSPLGNEIFDETTFTRPKQREKTKKSPNRKKKKSLSARDLTVEGSDDADNNNRSRRSRIKKSYSVDCLVIGDSLDTMCGMEKVFSSQEAGDCTINDTSQINRLEKAKVVDRSDTDYSSAEVKDEKVLQLQRVMKPNGKDDSSRPRRLKKKSSVSQIISDCAEPGRQDAANSSGTSEERSRRRKLKKSLSVDCLNPIDAEDALYSKNSEELKYIPHEGCTSRCLKKGSLVEFSATCHDGIASPKLQLVKPKENSEERSRRRRLKKSNSVDCLLAHDLDVDGNDSLKYDRVNSSDETSEERSSRRRLKKMKKSKSIECLDTELLDNGKITKQSTAEPRTKSGTSGKKKKTKQEYNKGGSAREIMDHSSLCDDKDATRASKQGCSGAEVEKRRARLKKSISIACLVDNGVEEAAVAKRQAAKLAKIREKAKKKPNGTPNPSLQLCVTSEAACHQDNLAIPSQIVVDRREERDVDEVEDKRVAWDCSDWEGLVKAPSEFRLNSDSKSQEKKVFAVSKRIRQNEPPTKMDFSEAFAQIRSNCSTLVNLDLSEISLSTAQCSALSMSLRSNWFLRELHLVSVRVHGPALGTILAHCLKQNKTLERLYLQSNSLGDMGTEALAAALFENETLQLLNLARNDVGDVGVAALAESLSTHRTVSGIKRLYLYENRIQDLGAEALAELIACNTSLEEVYVWENKFQVKGLADLTKAVKMRFEVSPPKPIHLRVSWKTSVR